MKLNSTIFKNFLLMSVLFVLRIAAETEPNNNYQQASTLLPNSTESGSLNAPTQTQDADNYDWWKVIIPEDGVLRIETVSDATLDLDLSIYDENGSTYFSTAYTRKTITETVSDDLLAGTYYVLVNRWEGYGSYTIKCIFEQASLANDTEPNDSYSQGINLSPNSTATGHLGFYNANKTDYSDYYFIQLPTKWDSLYIRTDSDTTLDIDISLFDASNNYLASAYTRQSSSEILGYSNSSGNTSFYIHVHRYEGYGSYGIKVSSTYPHNSVTDVKKEKIESVPTLFSLYQNYPNPFNAETTIKYDLPQNSNVTLKVYDILGNEVAVLVNKQQTAGVYSINFKAENLSSGIYFYKIEAGKFTQTKKLLLMK